MQEMQKKEFRAKNRSGPYRSGVLHVNLTSTAKEQPSYVCGLLTGGVHA
jgi:hypothetical protein